MLTRCLAQQRAFLRRWVSNATSHPSHLKKRFAVRSDEIWNEAGPVLEGYRYVEEEKELLTKYRVGRTVMGCLTLLHQKYERAMEFPQFCDLLGRMGRVAYNFEDKEWISDAYSPLILKLAAGIPAELELLNQVQLMHAYYGLSSLGPQILRMEITQRKRTLLVEELLQTFLDRALEIVDDLNGTDRCHLIEGRILVGKRLKPDQLELLLNDAYPLLKSRDGMNQVHPPNLTSLLWVMGKHGCPNKWKIVPTCLKELCQPKRFSRLRTADMARAVWGLGQLGVRSGHEEFMEKIQRYIQFTVDVTKREMFNSEVAEFAEGLALVGYEKGRQEIMDYLVRDAAKRLTPLSEQQKEKFLQACESIGYRRVGPKRSRSLRA